MMKRSDRPGRGAAAWTAAIGLAAAVAAAGAPAADTPAAGEYAVVVSRATHEDPAWRGVVTTLLRKHRGRTVVYDGDVTKVLSGLKDPMPRYACFVARPEEAGRQFVVTVHRLTRRLDSDPYTDVLWGILTGFRAEDAQRIADAPNPLIIRRAGAGTGLDLALFDEGKWFSEGTAGQYWQKASGGKPEEKKGPVDSTKAIVDFLNEGRPELFVTSGHATERDWQIGYSYKNGQLRCRDGKLFGVDLKGKTHPIRSPNPKVFLGSGNCLIGHVRDRQSMALAWLGSGGANQVVGYTVATWYGAMGWGTKDYLLDLPGRYSLAEAFFFTNQSVIYELRKRYPQTGDAQFERWDLRSDRRLMGRMTAKLGYRRGDKRARDHLGLLWDRDTVAFYGDPAWEARLKPRKLPLRTELTEADGTYTFAVHAERSCKPGKPLAMVLPHRLKGIEPVKGAELEPLITDRFLMLMNRGPFEPGKTYEVVFRAKRADR